jgi:hypothetical protein
VPEFFGQKCAHACVYPCYHTILSEIGTALGILARRWRRKFIQYDGEFLHNFLN